MISKKKKGAIESSEDERMGNAATASLGISATANLRPEEPKSRTTPDPLESSSLQTWCHDKTHIMVKSLPIIIEARVRAGTRRCESR